MIRGSQEGMESIRMRTTNKPLLSIAIPTYNRVHSLKECLDSIVCQFKDRDIYEQVEIVISDNASEDNTQELIIEYQKDFSNIRYFRNSTNLGFDRNVDNVITMSQGDFCWTLSDDEFIEEESLGFLLNIINNYPDISYICIGDYSILQDEEVRYFKNGNDWLKNIGLTGGLISQNIFNKIYLPSNREKYYDNLWLHFSIALEIIAHRPAILIKNIFKKPTENNFCRWAVNGWAFITYIRLKKNVQDLPPLGYDKKIIDDLLNVLAIGLPKIIASAKIHGLRTDWKNLKLLVNEFFVYPFWLIMSVLVFFTPTFILNILKKIKKFTF